MPGGNDYSRLYSCCTPFQRSAVMIYHRELLAQDYLFHLSKKRNLSPHIPYNYSTLFTASLLLCSKFKSYDQPFWNGKKSTWAVKKCDILLETILWQGWKLRERKISNFGMLRALSWSWCYAQLENCSKKTWTGSNQDYLKL